MAYNIIAYTLIRAAFEKGLQKVLDNPEREIRNLIDLGNDFSKGKNQRRFFEMAAAELERDDSIYYKVAERAIRNTNPDVILDFGLNLGYNSFIHGTRLIREQGEKKGHYIPWIILFRLNGSAALSYDEIARIIRQGKKMGIYSYVFQLSADFTAYEDLFTVCEREKDCAYFLLMPPAAITEQTAVRLLEVRNVFTAIDLDEADPAARETAAAQLAEYNCLRGGFMRTASMNDPALLDEADRLGLPFLCLIGWEDGRVRMPSREPSGVIGLRTFLQRPVFPMDLLGDIAMVDRYVSQNAALAVVQADGTLEVHDVDSGRTGSCNLHEVTLPEALQQLMPKDAETDNLHSTGSK